MSNTQKQKPYRPLSKENKEERKALRRRQRQRERLALQSGDPDRIPPEKGTEGWNTW